MTLEQQKDAERLRQYLIRENLSSVMNDTKWREAREIIDNIFGGRVKHRTKDVRGAEPPPSGWWASDFVHHMPHVYTWVEWMEVDPVFSNYRDEPGIDHTDILTQAFTEKNIPFYMVGRVFRIQGYTR